MAKFGALWLAFALPNLLGASADQLPPFPNHGGHPIWIVPPNNLENFPLASMVPARLL
ncbi:hypothetical protein HNQ75_004258 [Rhizobium flavum]|jgi:hypothetical protein|uniref:Uncharacterized protein n=1 Tax=Pseudorhizobium flavum TaxID=1335061 RepID=A0A7X0DGK9_9HYPH|nr:hypothetical protein [Pseudorhizobium flavum]CAD6631343.1 hypothetical protein RFYW14_04460 [Pseudorhizobium flavum]